MYYYTALFGPKSQNLPVAMEAYKQYLRGIYNVQQLPADDKYPLNCVKYFVNLEYANIKKYYRRPEISCSWEEIINGKAYKVKKERISIEQIACKLNDVLPNLVLIKGAPGVGKTTLSWELCRRWSRGELWTDYSLVILVQLRDVSVQEAGSVHELFQFKNADLPLGVESDILSAHTQGAGILFLLEGLDEMPPKLRENKNSIFAKLIAGCLLPASTVVVTTRPWAVSEIPKCCSSRLDQLIEITGFTPEQIEEYISKLIVSKEAPVELQAYFDANPHISSAMSNPLHVRIVVEVCRECCDDKGKVLPTTTTEIYTAYCRVLIERHLADHSVEEKWNGDLWILPQSLQTLFNYLCEIAYQGITREKQQLVFFIEDIPNVRATLGFMNSVHPLYQSASKRMHPSYNFIHFTLQEFLAAVYIWRNRTPQEQLVLFETKNKDGVYIMILLFLAGLTRFDDPWTQCVFPVPRFVGECLSVVCDSVSVDSVLWLYESQNKEIVNSYEEVTLNVPFFRFGQRPLSLQYYIALGYLIAEGKFHVNFDVYNTTDLSYTDFTDFSSIKDLVFGLKTYQPCLSQMNCVSISSNILKTNSVLSLVQCFEPMVHTGPGLSLRIIHTSEVSEDFYILDSFSDFFQIVEEIEVVCQHSTDKNMYKDYNNLVSMLIVKMSGPRSPNLKKLMLTYTKDLENIKHRLYDFVVSFQSLNIMEFKLPSHSWPEWIIFGINVSNFQQKMSKPLLPAEFSGILDIDDAYSRQQSVISTLKKLTHDLEYFILDSFELSDINQLKSFFQTIFACSSLKSMTIRCFRLLVPQFVDHRYWDISVLALEGLSAHASLQKVCIPYFPGLACSIFKALQSNGSVKCLIISVDFETKGIADAFGALLDNNKTLDSIEVKAETTCKPRLISVLKDGKTVLHQAHIGRNAFVAMMEHVTAATYVKKFGVDYRSDSFDVAISLSICKLVKNSTLQFLSIPLFLPRNDSFLQPLAEVLSQNSTLQTLIFKNSTVSEFTPIIPDDWFRAVSVEEAEALEDMLMVNKSLQIIHLLAEFSNVSPIIKGLAFNSTIKEFRVDQSVRESAIKLADYALARKKIVFFNKFEPFAVHIS